MQLGGPAKNVMRLAQTPGFACTASGRCSHRSGLSQAQVFSTQSRRINEELVEATHLNSAAFSPQIFLSMFTATMGMYIDSA
jgi:hypothetical protein